MESLQISARFKIHDGKLAEFKRLADEVLTTVKTKDKDTLQFDWFFNEDQTECVVREKYPDSKALLNHLANLGGLFGQLLAISNFKAEVYGDPSAELVNATAGLNTELYTYYQGIEVAAPVLQNSM